MNNNTESASPRRFFDVIDYSIVLIMLLLSTIIGIYFGFFSKRRFNTASEYLIGDRKISLFPIAMSAAASCIGSTQFLAFGTDFYKYGTQLLLMLVTLIIACFCAGMIFIPVLYELNVISSYEYFKLRFNNIVRTFGSFMFIIKMLVYLSTINYGPCLILSQFSGIDVKILIPFVSVVVIFYTSIGGLRAVIWTDTIQMILMIAGMLSITIIGVKKAGGLENVWEENKNAGRINFFQMSYDPSNQYTFWDVVFGSTGTWLSFMLVNQAMTQRCLALPTYKKALVGIWTYCAFVICFTISIAITALAAYTVFINCDPITSKKISKDDAIMPYFIMNITENIPAVPGIYLSAVFSSSLSTVSTGLNSVAGIILIDFIRPIWRSPIADAKETLIMKIIVCIIGTIVVAAMYLVDQLGDLFQTVFSFQAVTSGALLGLFTLGMLFPWANTKGALAGSITAIIVLISLTTGAQLYKRQMVTHVKTSLSIDGCDNTTLDNYYRYLNGTKAAAPVSLADQDDVFPLFKIPFLFYDSIGALTVVVVGLGVSFLTGPNNPKNLDPKLFPPFIVKFLKISDKKLAESMKLINVPSD